MSKQFTFNAISFLRDFNIPHTTEHHHCSANRVQVHCPFCAGSKNYHLGIHLKNAHGNCWRCGSHSIFEIVSKLVHCSKKETKKILASYANVSDVKITNKSRRTKTIYNKAEFKKPGILTKLTNKHKIYLNSRNFDYKELEDVWGIRSIGPIGEYRHRIFIPITYMNDIVSFQGRSTIKNATLRYKTCAPENEAIHHKNIIYGNDLVPGDTIVVVEGVTDAWRLGPGAVSVFGTSYTQDQVLRLGMYSNIYIMFDNDEPNAQIQAKKLGEELAFMKNTNVKIIKSPYNCDPAELPQSEAIQLMAHILKK